MPRSLRDSDTESDSADPEPEIKYSTTFQPSPTKAGHDTKNLVLTVLVEQAQLAIVTIGSVGPLNLEEKFDRIYQASGALMGLLNAFISRTEECMRCEDACVTLAMLFREGHLKSLFQLRQCFHTIAARELNGRNPKISVVSWVDVLLSKIGDTVMAIVSTETCLSIEVDSLHALDQHKEAISLQAALQLPQLWSDVIGVISSAYCSPACVRLAVRLTFATFVLSAGICHSQTKNDWPASGERSNVVLKSLQAYVQRAYRGYTVVRNDKQHEEQVTDAMVLSIYAALDCSKFTRVHSLIRPHTRAALLDMIQLIIMKSSDDVAENSRLCEIVNASQSILLKWGSFVPWTWEVWDDERILGFGVIEQLTIIWLYHLGTSSHKSHEGFNSWEHQIIECLLENPNAAGYIISKIIPRLSSRHSSGPLSPPETRVINRCCWSAAWFLRASKSTENSTLYHKICEILVILFVHLRDSEEEISAKDVILGGLVDADPEVLQRVLQIAGHNSSFKLKVEERISRMTHLTAEQHPDQLVSRQDILDVRQLLQFLVLMWHSKAVDCTHLQSAIKLLKNILARLTGGPADTGHWHLLETAFTALTKLVVATDCIGDLVLDVDKLCSLVTGSDTPDILLVSSFAVFIATVIEKRVLNAICLVDAWDTLRDFVFLIERRCFTDVDEPLAIMVGPAIFMALSSILKHAEPATLTLIMTSPWTRSLYHSLQTLSEKADNTEHDQVVHAILSPAACILSQQLDELAKPNDHSITSSRAAVRHRLLVRLYGD